MIQKLELNKKHFFCKLILKQITLYYVSERHVLNSSTYSSDPWSSKISQGALSRGNFSTAVNTRSLSVAQTESVLSNETSTGTDLALLYYENPTGKVSALSQETVVEGVEGVEGGESINTEWVDITSQESKSLPDRYRNTPGSTAEDYSKTLDESLDSNVFTLSAPFTCEGNSFNGPVVKAIFYSTGALNLEIQFNVYTTGPSGAGNFSRSMHFLFLYSLIVSMS